MITRITKFLAFVFLIIGGVILLYILYKTSIDGYGISNELNTNYVVTGQFGDFVGGVVGTFFALTGTLFIYLTFSEQSKENKRIGFESSFFEMMRMYRENISELRYRKYKFNEYITYENRHVISIIFKEFIDCYREVKKFSNSELASDYLSSKYHEKINAIISKTNPEIDPIEMARIDIAYSIVFYGLSTEGEATIRKLFRKKFNPKYFFRLLFFIKLGLRGSVWVDVGISA